jgi:formate-dependent nitrite reductase cytochrome c552 subunit
LPSAEAIARGRESCLQLGADLADAQQRFVAATAAYLASLDAAEAASRLLQQAREASRTAQDALARSVAQFGLEADVPVPPILDVGRVAPPVQKVVGLKTRFIFDAVGGPEDGQVVKELAAAVAEAQLDRLLPV